MRCNCGEPTCRGRIKRFGLLPRDVKERYLAGGLVPKYIIATLDERSSFPPRSSDRGHGA
jgi:hypothetical protein